MNGGIKSLSSRSLASLGRLALPLLTAGIGVGAGDGRGADLADRAARRSGAAPKSCQLRFICPRPLESSSTLC
jgi:hypothetical protein